MSEAAQPEVKKKGKLPVIIALVVVLAGGGFFGMKMKGGGKKEKPKVELGTIVEMEEMLVNLSDQESFLRTTLALHMRKDFEEAKIKALIPAVEDSVITVLKSKSPNQIAGVTTLPKLKREIAAKVNAVLKELEPKAGEEAEKDKKEAKDPRKKLEHPDWDSDEGPVLKVYFKAIAIQ